jgi:hypothetical protein
MDITVHEDKSKPNFGNPIGRAIEIHGTEEEIQDQVCEEISKSAKMLEKLYMGE